MRGKRYLLQTVAGFFSLPVLIVGCGGGNAVQQPPPPPPAPSVGVTVTPSSANVILGASKQFAASVTGTSNTKVAWAVNGIAGGNAAVGTIDSNGLYTAPADLPSPASVNVSATSQADAMTSAQATVAVISDISVAVATTPGFTLSVPTSSTVALTASVASQGKPDQSVKWSVNGIVGGNSTLGVISSTGTGTATYQAPATVPTPFTVTIAAASVADGTKSASMPMIVAGTIASISQTISAPNGGTITLPDGSSVTIPANALPGDQVVTLTELSTLPQQPPNQLVFGVGPSLVVDFATPIQPLAARQRPAAGRPTVSDSTQATNPPDIQFTINEQSAPSNGLNGPIGFSTLTDISGNSTFVTTTSKLDSTTAFASISASPSWLSKLGSAVRSFGAGLVNNVFVTLPNLVVSSQLPADKCWDANDARWTDFSACSSTISGKSVLVVVHGMMSCVEQMGVPISTLQTALGNNSYGAVVGFDYDWTQHITDSGSLLAAFLGKLGQMGARRIDILAHSEGVPVSIYGTSEAADRDNIKNIVGLAGPIRGTPVASNPKLLFDALLQFNYIVSNKSGSPSGACPAWSFLDFNTLRSQIFSGVVPFQTDLEKDSSTLTKVILPEASARLTGASRIFVAGGENPTFMFVNLNAIDGNPFATTPNDGIVGLDSALGFGSGLTVYPLPPFPSYFHTDLPQKSDVITEIGQQVWNSAPQLSCTSEIAGCEGHQNTMFTFSGAGYSRTGDTRRLSQDATGTVTELSQISDSSGTISWTTTPSCLDATGSFAIFSFDATAGLASNNVMQTIDPGSCSGTVILTVGSSNPATGATVSVSPADTSGVTSGTTQFTVTFNSGTTVTLSASPTAGGNSFSSWSGCATAVGVTCTVTVTSNQTVTANYAPTVVITHSLTVSSSNPNSGATITVSPIDKANQGAGNTPLALTYDDGTIVALMASATAGGNNFSSWAGCDSVSGMTCTITLTADRALTVNYTPPNTGPHTLTVASSNPISGAAVSASPSDNGGQSNGVTQFTLTYNTGTVVSLTAATTAGGHSFSTWTGCDTASNLTCTVTMGADRTVTANYGSKPAFAYVANQFSGDVSAYTVDAVSGALAPISSFAADLSPTSIASSPSGRCVYVANSGGGSSIISVFSVNTSDGSLVAGPGVPLSLDEFIPYSIAIHLSGKYMYVANQEGTISAFTIDSNTCALTRFPGSPTAAGTLPQFAVIDPSGNFLYVVNIASSDISGYRIDQTSGALSPIIGSPFPAGSLSMSLAIHPNGKFAYGTNADNHVLIYTRDTISGVLTQNGSAPIGGSAFSAAVDSTGKFLFAAYVGVGPDPGDIAVYAINPTEGSLTPVGVFTTGAIPIFVTVDPSDKFLYVANNGGSSVSAFRIDPNSGALTPVPPTGLFPAGGGPISVTITVATPGP